MMASKILIIDDEESIRHTFSAFLAKEGYATYAASDYQSGIRALSEERFDLVFMDIVLGSLSGIDILKEIKTQGHACPVVMITGDPDIDTAAASLRLGAFDYLQKPIKRETLVRVAKHAIQHKALLDEKRIIESENEQFRLHLEAIFRSVEDAIVTVDTDCRINRANDAFERICGIKTHSVMGEHILDTGANCCGMCHEVLKEALETKRTIREYRIECKRMNRPDQIVVQSASPLKDSSGRQIGAVMILRDVTRLSHLEKELQARHQFHSLIGRSKRMQEIYGLLENLKDIDTTVLITGQSGTGKELVARALHFSGIRAGQPFVVVNCSALAESLLESELFGHVKGAFTGAVKDKIGRFHMADHGTIFLDEIGDISPIIQLKLLRFLENKEFERVGDPNPIKLDVQVITATNQDLKQKVAHGQFREDLYYRLKVVEVTLPPLSQRRDDIPLLVGHYIEVFNNRFNKHVMGISTDVEKLFLEHPWPGNVRELIHCLEHAFVVSKKHTIEVDDLPPELKEHPAPPSSSRKAGASEKNEILKALEQTGGNIARAARILSISRQTVYRKIQEYQIRSLPGRM